MPRTAIPAARCPATLGTLDGGTRRAYKGGDLISAIGSALS